LFFCFGIPAAGLGNSKREANFMEHLATTFFLSFFNISSATLALYYLNPHNGQFIYSTLPAWAQNSNTCFILCAVLELYAISNYGAVLAIEVLAEINLLSAFHHMVTRLTEPLQPHTVYQLDQNMQNYTCLQHLIEMFNASSGITIGHIVCVFLMSTIAANVALLRHWNELDSVALWFVSFVAAILPVVVILLYGNTYVLQKKSSSFLRNQKYLALNIPGVQPSLKKYASKVIRSRKPLVIRIGTMAVLGPKFVPFCVGVLTFYTVKLLFVLN
jgi:hypothetical protein